MSAPGDLDVRDARGHALRRVDPRDPRCPRHLKRICGTCTHFAGALAAAGPRRCGYFKIEVTAGRSAAKCPRWVRKTAGAQ